MITKSIVLENLTVEGLKEMIDESVRKSCIELINEIGKKKQGEDLMTRDEVAEFLKINLSTLHYWTKDGKLKSYGLGNRWYYKRSEVLESLDQVKLRLKVA